MWFCFAFGVCVLGGAFLFVLLLLFVCLFSFLTPLSVTYASAPISSVLGCKEQLEELEPGTEQHLCHSVCSSAWRETRVSLDISGCTPNTHTLSCLGHSQLPLNAQYLLVMCHRERLQRIHESYMNYSWGINYSGDLAFVPQTIPDYYECDSYA